MAVRSLRYLPILAALPLLGCNAPGYGTLLIANNSGRAISFVSCRNKRFDLAPGEKVELTSVYKAIAPEKAWDCYAKQPFVVRATDGKSWTYTLPFAAFGPARQQLTDFAGSPREGINTPEPLGHSLIAIEVEPDGALRAGRARRVSDYRYDHFEVDFPTDVQPQGFPIQPQ